MAENYKILYEQMKKIVEKYQDDIVPGFRRVIDRLEAERKWISVEDIADAPTVGAVEVVRCKDCKHRYSDSWCEYVDDDDNFYCARGERKDGAD